MKPNELMIGDWVHIDSMSRVPPHNDQVKKIFEKYCDTDNSFIGWEYVEPIPLTEDIVDINNLYEFAGNGDGMDYSISVADDDGNCVYKSIGCNIVFMCKYVHEAQHILRYLGFTDRADNFKIQ